MRLQKLMESTQRGGKVDKSGSRGPVSTPTPIDGKSKQSAKNFLYNKVKPFTHNRLYKDDYWQGPKEVFGAFDQLGLNWQIDKSEYRKGEKRMAQNPMLDYSKVWYLTIWFDNNRGKQQKINGYVTAAGAGSVEDPLDKYDLVVVLS